MSQSVQLLKLYKENLEFFEENCTPDFLQSLFCVGKRNDWLFRWLIDKFNATNNVKLELNYPKGLSLPRFKILMSLVAQKEGFEIFPSLTHRIALHFDSTPERFKTKFKSLMVPGFYLLGTLIEDSLSDDPSINCGNPFSFLPEDLGYWWAGVVILDWLKYKNVTNSSSKYGVLENVNSCYDFYKDACLSRKFRYYQNSAISSLKRCPEQFLSNANVDRFLLTVQKLDLEITESEARKLASCLDLIEEHCLVIELRTKLRLSKE